MTAKLDFKISVCIFSFGLYLLSWANLVFNWYLLNMPLATFSALTIFIASILLWLFVATDWPSLLAVLAIGLVPGIGFSQASVWSFGNTTFTFLLFTFLATYALNQTPFLKRLTAKLLKEKEGQTGYAFVCRFLLVVLFLSSFLSPTVTFMFLFPLYEEITLQMGWQKGDKAASYFLIGLFSTLAIGTAITPINHVFVVTAMSLYEAATGLSIGNLSYMLMAIPVGLLLFGILLGRLKKVDFGKPSSSNLSKLKELPAVTSSEKWIVTIFFSMIGLWIFPELLADLLPSFSLFFKNAGLLFPPLAATVCLSCLKKEGKPLLDLSQALSKGVHWPSLLLVAATLALGSLLSNEKVGVLALLQNHLAPLMTLFPHVLIFIFIAWAGLQTNFTSNLVTVSLVTTLLLSIRPSGIHLGVLASLIGFMSSMAMMTAPSMPYVAISIGSGWTNAKDCFKLGGYMLSWTILLVTFLAYPLGLYIF